MVNEINYNFQKLFCQDLRYLQDASSSCEMWNFITSLTPADVSALCTICAVQPRTPSGLVPECPLTI